MDEACLRGLLSVNIKRFRLRQGLSQARLAEKIDMSTNYLSDIECGRGWVSPDSLAKLSNALGIEVFELFKPWDSSSADALGVLDKCLDDFAAALRLSFEKSLADSMQRAREHL